MSDQKQCKLCGHLGDDVVYRVIVYVCGKPVADYACRDRDACTDRFVEQQRDKREKVKV